MDVPVVRIFDTLTPTNSATGEFELHYEDLGRQLDELSKTNPVRSQAVWEAPEDSVQEENAARQLASEYFAKTAGKLILAHDPEKRSLWANRYNEAASELYEVPDRTVVIELMERERADIITALHKGRELSPAASMLLETYDRILPSDTKEADTEALSEEDIQRATEDYKTEMLSRYGDVFELIEGKAQFTVDDLKNLFEEALRVLQNKGEAGWDEWKVIMKDSRIVSVNARTREIEIGRNKPKTSASKVRELIAHELLVHGLRANNSHMLGDRALIEGLPGYADTEEGLGKFAEHAISGNKLPTSADHYVDIGLALGVVGGEQLNRHEVFELALARKIVRVQLSGKYDSLKFSTLLEQTAASVDRIFYGTPGDTLVAQQAVFIKETGYYGGYRKILEYVVKAQREGKSMTEIFDFMNSGRFDPTNSAHTDYMKEQGRA